ncbi:hypothetical protein DMX09_29535 [Pseudomonas protegens]|nr:hypothetical protein [Pseudomonas protegens]NMY72305.1 hypothetical protein [Pseudomonas sp. WS 5414]PNG35825.1 hypothetical protein A1395_31145 [Pseudomonas protegens]PYB95614.1 hypothetical protein DMX09_29535 [Pseudomonas protegens]
MIWLKRFLMSIGALTLILVALGIAWTSLFKEAVHTLPEHPRAQWQGGVDGGHYVEVTRSEAPYYFVQVRYESGDLWSEGWLRHEHGDGAPFSADDVIAFDGDGVIFLQQRKVLAGDKSGAR